MRGLAAQEYLARSCKHCEQPLGRHDRGDFCCMGCRVVYRFLHSEDLQRFYTFRAGTGLPVRGDLTVDRAWCEEQQEQIAAGKNRVRVAINGMHCSACNWLIEALFRRQPGALGMELHAAYATAVLRVGPDFELLDFALQLRRAGYHLSPPSDRAAKTSQTLTQLGMAGALSLNIMILAIARYLGLADQPLANIMLGIETTLAFFVLLVGLESFGRTSLAALRTRTPHLDVPIALGMVLAWSGSTFSVLTSRDAIFFDSFAAFVTLMLVGRWLQGRTIERSRAFAQDSGDVGSLRCKVRRGDRIERARFADVQLGDTLMVGQRDVLPTRARIKLAPSAPEGVPFSLAWATGESRPVHYHAGDEIPAGAICESTNMVAVEALEDFSGSTLPRLLRTPNGRAPAISELAKWYLAAVLVVGTLGFGVWWFVTDAGRAVEVATAFFVVTCPCVFGVVVPLAKSVTQSRLRALGIFLRSEDFLERLAVVEQIALDKTGTLTAGNESLSAETRLHALNETELRVLRTLASFSSHPKARTVEALLDESVTALEDALPGERTGQGIELAHEGSVFFLGRTSGSPDLVFRKDTEILTRFAVGEETLAQEAESTLTDLRKSGYTLVLLSGDSRDRAEQVGKELGFESAQILPDLRPEQKRDWLEAHSPEKTLYVGDGVNDILAAEVSACSIAPAQASSFIANRTDAFWVRDGLTSLRSVLDAAKRLRTVTRNIVAAAVLYNVLIAAVALSGQLLPWQAALIMPVTSLLFTGYALLQTSTPRGHA